MAGYSFPHEFPTIDPISFDLIVYGSGLPESLLAAAASSAGKTVLHLDPNPFYGSHFASLPLPSFSSSLQSTPPSPSKTYTDDGSASSSLYHVVDLERRHVYSGVEFSVSSEPPGSFILDLSGPRVLYCADLMVDLMLRSGASHHVEFKSVERSMFYWEGQLFSVPGSRQDIFTDRSLTLAEKRHLTMLLELVQDHIASCKVPPEEESIPISPENLEIPFSDYLREQKISPKIRTIILYAIALADYDQDCGDTSRKLIKTKEGIERISLYISSHGRFSNAVGSFIYPIYGHGELPQAFCRCVAVKGALYANMQRAKDRISGFTKAHILKEVDSQVEGDMSIIRAGRLRLKAHRNKQLDLQRLTLVPGTRDKLARRRQPRIVRRIRKRD
ncbi:hypothetical protein KSP39_PZI000125 [Platanthera zijinensis]|uniref:Uncharacterized protein n=1 Tax=Platanthera zijinensis TaxID=2320716 RepID=A0AAP0BZX2_9ASPA